ncbi:hypothetical protein Tco_1184020 [Tanacetum coccineum]|uniref:Uncharacterized protein n=1 Tax=Tanacetum coccineum TaxID=301880 RepID=A0ABQ4WHV8_9ASTR
MFRSSPTANLPYGMFLTRLYQYVMETYPHLDNDTYDIVLKSLRPLLFRQTIDPDVDRGKACHSVSSTSAYHKLGSLSHQGDDDEASRASTLSPTTYLLILHHPLSTTKNTYASSSKQR